MPERLHHAILGPGGVGGLVGACLAHSGASVTLVVRPESLAHYPKRLRLEGAFGNFDVEVARASEVPSVDVLWITVKATQLESVLTVRCSMGLTTYSCFARAMARSASSRQPSRSSLSG